MADNITILSESTIEPLVQDYIVDFASNNNFFFVKGVQGDGYGTRYARLSLSNNGQPYVINQDAIRAIIRGTKPDTKQIFNECEIVNESTIQFELTNQMLAVAGKGEYEISIMSTTENRTLTSFPFFIITSKSSFDASYVTSSDEFTLLISKINQVDLLITETKDAIDDAEDAIENCEKATEEATTATSDLRSLETELKNSENARVEAENDRVEAEKIREDNIATAIEKAEQATSDTVTATSEAQKRIDEYDSLDVPTVVQNATKAANNADIAKEEVQKRIDEYDSLNLATVTQDAINATVDANIAIENTNQVIENAEQATQNANIATEEANQAVKNIQNGIGIDDTQITPTTAWSSSYTQEIINMVSSDINELKENITFISNDKIDTLFM